MYELNYKHMIFFLKSKKSCKEGLNKENCGVCVFLILSINSCKNNLRAK